LDEIVAFEGKREGKPDEGSYVAAVGGTDGSDVGELVELRGKLEEADVAPVGKAGGVTVLVAGVGGTEGSSVGELVTLRGKLEEADGAPVGNVGGATV